MDYRLKNNKTYRTSYVGIRCTEVEKNRLQLKANIYSEGNLSAYMLYAALNYSVKRSDLQKGDDTPLH